MNSTIVVAMLLTFILSGQFSQSDVSEFYDGDAFKVAMAEKRIDSLIEEKKSDIGLDEDGRASLADRTSFEVVSLNVSSYSEEVKAKSLRISTEERKAKVQSRKVKPKKGYCQEEGVKVYKSLEKGSKVIYELSLNEEVEYVDTQMGWYELRGLNYGYVKSKFIADTEFVPYKVVKAPTSSGVKSMESYRVFRMSGTHLNNQGRLQLAATTDSKGFRKVGDRYCIAVGSAVCDKVGTCIDLVLENGTIIPCVMGDQKADCHTDRANFKSRNGCISEFIVDLRVIDTTYGDVSYIMEDEGWMSPVSEFRVYELDVLQDIE